MVLASKQYKFKMIQKDSRSAFSAFRIKKDTVKFLQDMKRAYEISYGREYSNDEFIKQMAAAVENGDSAVWEIYSKMQSTQKELEEMAAINRRLRSEQ